MRGAVLKVASDETEQLHLSVRAQWCLDNIPLRTLQYFASTYAGCGFTEAVSLDAREIVQKLEQAHTLSKVMDTYQEAVRDIERYKDEYDYYILPENAEGRTPTTFEKALAALEEEHLFGKAVFLILLQLGVMETKHGVFYAVEKGK